MEFAYKKIAIKTISRGMIVSAVALSFLACPALTGSPGSVRLIQEDDLSYQGAFRVPGGSGGGDPAKSGYAYGGAGLAFNPDRNTLLLTGHVYDQRVGEISIPLPVKSDTIGSLKTATVVQGLADVMEGNLENIGEGGSVYGGSSGVRIGGLLPWKGRLVGAVYGYYDAGSYMCPITSVHSFID